MLLTTRPATVCHQRDYELLLAHWRRVANETMSYPSPEKARARGRIGPFPADIWRHIYQVGNLRHEFDLAAVCKGMLECVCISRHTAVMLHRHKVLEAMAVQLGVLHTSYGRATTETILNRAESPWRVCYRDGADQVFVASVVLAICYVNSPAMAWVPRSAIVILCPSRYVPHGVSGSVRSLFLRRQHTRGPRETLDTIQSQAGNGRLNTSYVQVDGIRMRSRSLLYDMAREPLMRMICPGMHEYWVTCGGPPERPMRIEKYPDDIMNILWKVDDGDLVPVQEARYITPHQDKWLRSEMAAFGTINGPRALKHGITNDQIGAWLLLHPNVTKSTLTQTKIAQPPPPPPLSPEVPIVAKRNKRALADLMASTDSDDSDARVCKCPTPIWAGYRCTLCTKSAF